MNARDNIKPKSIRVAILQALSDGAITTIDDLQIKMDEKREKIANNVYPAAAEGLIKRMRDDVTGGAAYQILPKGRELLAKYASGKFEAPADVVEAVAVEKSVITPGVKVENEAKECALLIKELRAIAKDREDRIGVLDDVLTQALDNNAATERMFQAAISALASINERLGLDPNDGGANPILAAIDELERSRAPVGYVIQRPAKPLVRFTKAISAEARAMAFAKGGQRAQVFALTLVGTAVPGAEWRKA